MSSFLSKMGFGDGGLSSLLPLQTSPPSVSLDEHDLDNLSPRPDESLLYQDNFSGHGDSPTQASSIMRRKEKGKGKEKAIAFAYPERQHFSRTRPLELASDSGTPTDSALNDIGVPPGIWRANVPSEPRSHNYGNTEPNASLIESLFLGRPNRTTDHTIRVETDSTFKIMRRRERQLEKEFQKLIDIQSTALERDLDEGKAMDPSPETSRREGSFVPVRQPRKRPVTKRQARSDISRSLTLLIDLKNEEDEYMSGAILTRKASLAKLRNLSFKRKSVVTEMNALEEDHGLPIKNKISQMEHQYRAVCSDIDELEEKLKELKRVRANLKYKLGEATSIRDANLSSYKGALKQYDENIAELMKYPGISVLDVEVIKKQRGNDVAPILAKHMSGTQFLTLRPERRTAEMAKDWWEGEVAILDQCKALVDGDRVMLEEGYEIWQRVVALVTDFEDRLNVSLKIAHEPGVLHSDEAETILGNQYKALKNVIGELQTHHDYINRRGWNLLIVIIGAELAHLVEIKAFLGSMIREGGYGDGIVTPPRTPGGDNLVDVHENGISSKDEERKQDSDSKLYDEELSRSVVRRWDDIDEQQGRDALPPLSDVLGGEQQHEENSDNEVPQGLLSEVVHHESEEDERHNDVPAEFLSMHSPPQSRGGQDEAAKLQRVHVRRESSETENEVPPDLLSESRRDDD